jgi:hypothetical protein
LSRPAWKESDRTSSSRTFSSPPSPAKRLIKISDFAVVGPYPNQHIAAAKAITVSDQ